MLARCQRCREKVRVKKLKGRCPIENCGGWNSLVKLDLGAEKERIKRVAAKRVAAG